MEPVLGQYLWLVVAGALGAFGFGWGTGANDVANAFGTSVGAKTLTLRQAVIIAIIMESTGALVLGRVSIAVISGQIANPDSFARQPEMYAYGMSCTLFVGTVWLALTSFLGYNVSSTHTIIGGIIGFALVHGGSESVNWATKDATGDNFPPYSGVLPIILSWFISPLLTSAGAALIFFLVRTIVLRRRSAHELAAWVLPPFVFLTVLINVYFVLTKGAASTIMKHHQGWPAKWALEVSALVALGAAVLSGIIGVPLILRRTRKFFEELERMPDVSVTTRKDDSHHVSCCDHQEEEPSCVTITLQKTWRVVNHGMAVDIHDVVETDPVVAALHERAEKFGPQVEYVFGYLQVFSAICVILAHGAGEVGYMVGPLGAIWDIYNKGYLPKEVAPPIWIIFIGTIGLVVGLATYGYNVTRAMGTMMVKLSPSRGFAAELSTSLVILLGAQYGLPTSSSQCIIGGVVGVGLLEGVVGVNWAFFAKQFTCWVLTLVFAGSLTAALYAQGVYAPSEIDGRQVKYYEDALVNVTGSMYANFNKTLYDYKEAAQGGAISTLSSEEWARLNASVTKGLRADRRLTDVKAKYVSMTVRPSVAVGYLENILSLVQNHSILTLGQELVVPGAQICNSNVTKQIRAGAKASCPAPKLV